MKTLLTLALALVALPAFAWNWEVAPSGDFRFQRGAVDAADYLDFLWDAYPTTSDDPCGFMWPDGAIQGQFDRIIGPTGIISWGYATGTLPGDDVYPGLIGALMFANEDYNGNPYNGRYKGIPDGDPDCSLANLEARDTGADGIFLLNEDELLDVDGWGSNGNKCFQSDDGLDVGSGPYLVCDSGSTSISNLVTSVSGRALRIGRDIQDDDGDGVDNMVDLCLDVANAANCDTDGDGFGNACDGDFDQGGTVNSTDFNSYFVPDFGTGTDSGTGTDMDCSGAVNQTDYSTYFVPQFNQGTPGPSCCD